MSETQATHNQSSEALPESEVLIALTRDIIDSGALGRSKVYASLLDYLTDQALRGNKPKEIEIAMEALGKGADFDVSKDSLVRVYIYQLRKKLHAYYEKHQPNAPYRVSIPKGQYSLAIERIEQSDTAGAKHSQEKRPLNSFTNSNWMLGFIAFLLLLNLASALVKPADGGLPEAAQQAAICWFNKRTAFG